MKSIACALLVALGGAVAACAQQPTAPAEPGSTTTVAGSGAVADTAAAPPVTEPPNFRPRKKGIGTE
jgi:hypothetical protein